MKKNFQIIVALIMLGFIMNACKKDESTTNGSITFDGINYPTPHGMLIFKHLIGTDLAFYYLQIYSSNFTFDNSTGEINQITGTGKIITFYVTAPITLTDVNADGNLNAYDVILDNLALESGNYSISSEYTSKTYEADFTVDASESSDYNVYSINSGDLVITKTGTNYKITLIGKDENDIDISVDYNGTLNVLKAITVK